MLLSFITTFEIFLYIKRWNYKKGQVLLKNLIDKISVYVDKITQGFFFGKFLVFLIITFLVIMNVHSVKTCTENVQATVRYVSYSYDDNAGKEAYITYTYNGKEYNGVVLSSMYQKGDVISIRINPNNPTKFIQDPLTYFIHNMLITAIFVATVFVLSKIVNKQTH